MEDKFDFMDEEFIAHYGVLGMKWGIRKDGKPQGWSQRRKDPKRKTAKDRVKVAKQARRQTEKKFKKDTIGGLLATKKDIKKVQLSAKEEKWAKQDLQTTKVLQKMEGRTKSKYQLKKEAQYLKEGMSSEQAQVQAYLNNRTRNTLMVIGGMTATAALAYTGYKLHDYNIDKIIPKDTLISRIGQDNSKGVRDAFYGATNRLDKAKYKGLYADQLMKAEIMKKTNADFAANLGEKMNVWGMPRYKPNLDVFQKEIKVLSDIRQASPKNALKVFQDIAAKDPSFLPDFKKQLSSAVPVLQTNHMNTYTKAIIELNNGKAGKNAYEMFNVQLANHDFVGEGQIPLAKKFYSELTSRGYNAIRDVNDQKYSNYKAINPLITFGASGKVKVSSIKELAMDEINRNKTVAYADLYGREIVKAGASIVPGILAQIGLKKVVGSVGDKKSKIIIDNYKKEHPGTKLSDRDIERMLLSN